MEEINIRNNIPKEIKKIIGNKNIITNIYRIQAYDLIMCGYFCTGFVDFMLKGKSLLNYTNLFSRNTKIFSKTKKVKMKKLYYVFCGKSRNIIEKTLVLSIIYSKYKNEEEKISKEESIEILEILSFIENI